MYKFAAVYPPASAAGYAVADQQAIVDPFLDGFGGDTTNRGYLTGRQNNLVLYS